MISIVLLSVVVGLAVGGCPDKPETIAPCVCQDNRITCRTFQQDYDLLRIFEALGYGHNRCDQNFEYFELSSDTIEELPADVFQNVCFRQIFLNYNPRLGCVNPRAFAGMEDFTTRFYASFSNFSEMDDSKCNIFSALGELKNLEEVNITASHITEIPERAFHGLGNRQEHLWSINLNGQGGGSISKIHRNAFNELRNLRYIDLSNNKITSIDSMAFSFLEPSDNELSIKLYHNEGLTGFSFEGSVFSVGNRRTTLDLGGNPTLGFLPMNTFLNFFENKGNPNKIDLTGSPLDYDYENEWLFEYKASLNLVDKISNCQSRDGQGLWVTNPKKYTASPTPPTTAGSTQAGTGSGGTTASGGTTQAGGTTATTKAAAGTTATTPPTTASTKA